MVAAIPTCSHPKARRGSPSRSTTERASQLPSAIPTRNDESIVTNAYVEVPSTTTSSRAQITSSDSDANPESAIAASSQPPPCAGVAAGVSSGGRGPSSARSSDAPPRHESQRAAAPTPRFAATASHRVGWTPSARIRTNPAARLPTTAPAVLSAYSDATSRPTRPSRWTTARLIAGSVAPMRNVGGRTTADASSIRNAISATESGASRDATKACAGSSPPTSHAPASAVAPMPSSRRP